MEPSKIVRLRDVCALTGLSASTIYRLEKADRFPGRRQLSTNSVGWLRSEVDDWIASRPHLRRAG